MNLQKDTMRLAPRLCSGKNTLQLSGPILTVVFIVVFVTANCGIGAADDKSRFYSAQLMDDGSTVLFTYANTKYKLKSSSLFFGGSRSVYTKDRKIIGYVFRNAMLPQITGLALSIGTMVGGALVAEIIFSYPGLGYTLMNGIMGQDYPLISAAALIITIMVLSATFIIEILYGIIDPRIKAAQAD